MVTGRRKLVHRNRLRACYRRNEDDHPEAPAGDTAADKQDPETTARSETIDDTPVGQPNTTPCLLRGFEIEQFDTPALPHDGRDPKPEHEPPAARRRLVRRPPWLEDYETGHSSLEDESSSEGEV